MNNLQERYIYDVTRRLPAADRAEVAKELAANIADMLPENPTHTELEQVLLTLGEPRLLAEQYRQCPRYLIGPAVYEQYLHVIKLVLPIVGIGLLVVGAVLGGLSAEGDGAMMLAQTASVGVSTALSAMVQTLLWVTLGFVIYERTTQTKASKAPAWSLASLPDEVPSPVGKIPLADSITELVFTLLSVVFLAVLLQGGFYGWLGKYADVHSIQPVFTREFSTLLWIGLLVSGVFSVAECITKIVHRRWNKPTCIAVLVNTGVALVLMVVLAAQQQMFTPEFMETLTINNWLTVRPESIFRLILGLAALICIIDAGVAVYRTRKAAKELAAQ